MPPRGVKQGTKRARQYEHVKQSELDSSKSESTAEEIAARTVNKEKARHGESRTRSKSSTTDINRPKERTRDQLYNEASQLDIPGRSRMNKAELLKAIDSRKG